MNILPRDKQIEVIAALCEGVGTRAAARITGVNRGTVGALALRIGRGCAAVHDGKMSGVRTNRVELDEAWSFVGKKQKHVKREENVVYETPPARPVQQQQQQQQQQIQPPTDKK